GMLKVSVHLKELRLAEAGSRLETRKQEKPETRSGWMVKTAGDGSLSPELDLRGLTVEEACHQVDAYLDDAVLAGLNQVSLIHGKGTGVLRTALQDYLRQHPLVKGFRLGGAGEGGSGVTVVNIGK
ncbi:MAG: Smr/MutS family protein, partial [Moorella sp. (in: Bacteria)]|nr:Smr/MutS family protein [Moorella sp. (in: firmicutes)]